MKQELVFVIAGVQYSPNLGDGVIAECFEYAIRKRHPRSQVAHIDISGRRNYVKTQTSRTAYLKIQRLLPRNIKRIVVSANASHAHRKSLDYVASTLERADLFCLAGGQILSDVDLNFPKKTSRLFTLASTLGIAQGIYGVGVSNNWTKKGTSLFCEMLSSKHMRAFSVRDVESKENLESQSRNRTSRSPNIVPDAGILASDVYGAGPLQGLEQPTRIGINISDPENLNYSGDATQNVFKNINSFYGKLTKQLVEQGHDVHLFTNGAFEDQRYLENIELSINQECTTRITVEPRPSRPEQLAHCIASCGVVVAHRLHASIIASSYGRPSIGLGWDTKVESYYAKNSRSEWFVAANKLDSVKVAQMANELAGTKISSKRTAALKAECRAAIDIFLRNTLKPEE